MDATGEGRRRAVFAAARAGSRVMLGFHERASHRLVDLRVCPVVLPEIVAAMDDLRELASLVMPRKGEVTLTVLATGTGLDVALATPAKISPRSVPQIVEQAMGAGFARLSLNGETLVEARAPILSVDGLPLVPPPGGFVQATLGSEIEVPTLGGKARINVPAGTQSGTILRLRGKGVKNVQGYGHGDLHVRVIVEVPTRLNSEQKAKLNEFGALCDDRVNPMRGSFFEKAKKFFS